MNFSLILNFIVIASATRIPVTIDRSGDLFVRGRVEDLYPSEQIQFRLGVSETGSYRYPRSPELTFDDYRFVIRDVSCNRAEEFNGTIVWFC
jgi:hypothetical protein